MNETDLCLSGKEVSLTGRLISMPRFEARERIVKAGGRYVSAPASSTAFLVAGQASGHVTSEGGIARNLQRFRELKDRGARIRLIEEPEFLRMLGAEEELTDFSRLYTAAQVSRIVETPLSEVRAWLRHGLLQPARLSNRLPWFEFKDILLARALSRLSAAGVPPAKIRRSLSEIAAWLPDADRILGRLDAATQSALRVRLEDGGWAEPSGQRLLGFDREDPKAPLSTYQSSGDYGFWFSRAVEAEEKGDLRVAAAHYARALDESAEAETYFNLGNVLYELGREGDAAERYLSAIGIDGDFIEAWNNLGNALVALGKAEEAIHAYRKALSVEPGYPDAHFNLATILTRLGRLEEAAAHRAEYVKAFPSEARLRLLREPETDDTEG